MYERNAIILERYFDKLFGYDKKENLKTNFKDYCELVDCLERYRDISDEEENIIQEYDLIANKIRDIQVNQEKLNKKNIKYQEEREEIFQNIDENPELMKNKFESINNNIQMIESQIKENSNNFIDIVAEFNEKTNTRTTCGRNVRNIEAEYNKKLNNILDNYKEIDIDAVKRAKQFSELVTEDLENELKERIKKNGEKEKIPFNMDVVTKAISLSVDVQKRETEILCNVYEKTSKLFNEIKNNSSKGDKHKKIIKESRIKLEFVGALKEYLVQFLDNERLTAVNGIEEHNKLMKDACENLEEDLVQINNLYTLLLKEINKKITKKSYEELYNLEYLKSLEKKSEEFEKQIKKLNLPVTIINPNYWRIEGMKKIYDIFYKNVTEEYGRDLSEYMIEDEVETPEIIEDEDWELKEEPEVEEKKEAKIKEKVKQPKRTIKGPAIEENSKNEIDRKIDMILGFDNLETGRKSYKDDDELDDAQDDDFEDDNENDEVYYDIWGNDINDKDGKKINYDDGEDDENDDDWDDDEYEDDEEESWEDDGSDINNDENDSWDDEDDNEIVINSKNNEDDNDDGWDDEDEWDDDWEDDEDEEEKKKQVKKSSSKSSKKTNDDWGNEFVKVNDKDKTKKKKSFLDKFKK